MYNPKNLLIKIVTNEENDNPFVLLVLYTSKT